MSLEPGKRLGPYEIVGAAGAGGMGEVYRARDTRLDRDVAIKVLPAHLSLNEELRKRFDREAKTISSLQHPNICMLYDVGHENGTDFLVMEYLEGETLADRLKNGPLPVQDVMRLGVQITEALDAAHKSGVTHRDLKPGNIIVTRTGAKLLDFGLAKMAAGGAVETDSSSFTQLATEATPISGDLTEKGTVLGTFQYMSPEQLEGQEADARSDIFALGAVLYEMATGHKAFEGKGRASLIASIMSSQPPSITSIEPMTPPALDRVIRICLEKDPDSRWQTAHDVALQLKWIDEGGSAAGIPKPVASRRRSRERTAWIVAAVAGIAALGQIALRLTAPTPEPPSAIRVNIEAPAAVVSFGSPRISPDGKYIAFDAVDTTGTTQMWLRPLNTLDAHPLPGAEDCNRPFWSPDSRYVAFFNSENKLQRIPVTGGPPLTVCEFPGASDGVWGSNGVILFDATASDSLHSVPAGGGVPVAASSFDRTRGETGHGWPHFLPDGEHFVFLALRSNDPNEIRIGKLGTFETRFLCEADSRVEYVPPGFLVYEKDGTLLAHPIDPEKGELTGDPFPLAEGIGSSGSLAHFSASNTGALLYTGVQSNDREIVWVDRQGRELETVAPWNRYFNPALSPDEGKLAVDIAAAQSADIWMLDLRRNVRLRFTFDTARDHGAVWSPDASRIVWSSNRDGDFDLWIKNTSGTGTPEKLLDNRWFSFASSWHGNQILVNAFRSGWDIQVLTVGDTAAVDLVNTEFDEYDAMFSPDGRYISYVSEETGTPEIFLATYPPGGGRWLVSQSGGLEPSWRGDGGELYFISPRREVMSVELSLGGSPVIGQPRRLFLTSVSSNTNSRNRYLPSPDGRRFLVSSVGEGRRAEPATLILNWTAELTER